MLDLLLCWLLCNIIVGWVIMGWVIVGCDIVGCVIMDCVVWCEVGLSSVILRLQGVGTGSGSE